MTSAASLSAIMLAGREVSDEQFFGATALLSTRLEMGGSRGDLRTDAAAPMLLFDWFAHADARVPDLRVFDLNCQLRKFFEVDSGLCLPRAWPWDTRDRVLELSDRLSARAEWASVFARAIERPTPETIRALMCCAAERYGADPYMLMWAHLSEHVDNVDNWQLIAPAIDALRLPEYLELARLTLVGEEFLPEEGRAGHGRAEHGRAEGGRAVAALGQREELWDVWQAVLRVLHQYPGEGLDLVERALRSQDAGLRIVAIELLALHWRGRSIPYDTLNLVAEQSKHETDATASRGFEMLLYGAR